MSLLHRDQEPYDDQTDDYGDDSEGADLPPGAKFGARLVDKFLGRIDRPKAAKGSRTWDFSRTETNIYTRQQDMHLEAEIHAGPFKVGGGAFHKKRRRSSW